MNYTYFFSYLLKWRRYLSMQIKGDVTCWWSTGYVTLGGERGIRTPGGVTLNGFQDRRNRPLCHLSENPSGFSRTIFCISSAERTRFELVVENNPYDSLANCWFQPLTHLSSGSLLRVQRYIRYFSLPNFLGCFFAVIFHNICKSLSVSGGCGTLWLRSFAMRQILSMFAYASRQSRPNQVWMLCARFALSYGEKKGYGRNCDIIGGV